MAKETAELAIFNAKAMIAKNSVVTGTAKDTDGNEIKVGRKIKYAERKKVEIIKPTKHYQVGQQFNPHVTMAEALIEQGIAKEVK